MSWLGPILQMAGPAIGKLAGAGATAGLGAAAAKEGGVGALSGAPNGLPDLTKMMMSVMTALGQSGQAQSAEGAGNMTGSANFMNTIMNGSQENTAKVLGPATNTVMDQYDAASKAGMELGPRGGGRANAIEAAKVGKVGAYGKLLAPVQANAANNLASIGEAQSKAGQAQTGQAISGFGPGLDIQYKAGQAAAKRVGDMGTSIGNSIGSGLGSAGKALGGSGGGSGSGLGVPGGYTDPSGNWYQGG